METLGDFWHDKTGDNKLTDERKTKNTFKPFKYPWAYDAWLQHEQSHWLHSEVPMGEDLKDYQKKLNQGGEGVPNQNPTLLCAG
jgi:ribonucleotide reductase beta subunit family protein with ferritin-like domain